LPPIARTPAPDRPPSPFETLLDNTAPPAADPPPSPPPENKASASDTSRPPAKNDDAKATEAADNSADSTAPETGTSTIDQPGDKPGKDDDKVVATKVNSDAGDIIKSNSGDKSDAQKKDKSDAAIQIDASLTPPAPQVVATAAPGVAPAVVAADGGDTTGPALEQTALSTAIAAQVKQPGPAPSRIDAAKTSDESKKTEADDKSADTNLDPSGKFQLAGDDNAVSHTGEKLPTTPGDADKQHVTQARAEAMAGSHSQLDANASAGGKVDVGAQSTQLAGNALMQPANVGAPQQPTDPSVLAAGSPSQQNPPAVAIPVAGLAVEIAGKALAGKNRFEIRLDPPVLGRIEVRLDVDRDGNVTSRLTVDRQDTLNLLQRDASGLERALQDAGLKTADNGLQFSLRDQSMNQQQSGSGANTAQLVVKDESMPTVDIIPQSYGRLLGLGSGLDIRV